MNSNTADTGGPGRHARDRKPRTAAAPPGGGTSGQELPGWQDRTAGRHAAPAQDRQAQSTGAGPGPVTEEPGRRPAGGSRGVASSGQRGQARGDGAPPEHAPVARRTANGWKVGDEEV